MTNKPRRRRSRAVPVIAQVAPESGFWSAIASYASELAPVARPLLEAIGQTAGAIERAEGRNRELKMQTHLLQAELGDFE